MSYWKQSKVNTTFTLHSRQSLKIITILEMKKYLGKIEYLNQNLKNVSLPEISKHIFDTFLYLFDKIVKDIINKE